MEPPTRNPRRIQSYNSVASQQVPKQYRVLGLASKPSSTSTSSFNSNSNSTSTFSTSTSTLPVKTQEFSDHLSNLIKHISRYYNLYDRLPPTLIERNLRTERPTDTFDAYRQLETEFARCLLGLRDTLWSIQTQLKDENAFVRNLFREFEYEVKKYLTKCLKGWRGILMVRSYMRHYRAVSGIHRILKKELGDVKEIMDAVGPHCKDMLLNVDVEVVEEWILALEKSRTVGFGKEDMLPRIDVEAVNAGLGRQDSIPAVPSPTSSERSMERLFRLYHLPSFSSNITTASTSDSEMDRDYDKKKKGRRSYLRASILKLN